MTIHKCKGCKKAFATERGLSTHFQHKHVCKSIHYGIANPNIELNDFPSQSKKTSNQKKTAESMIKSEKSFINNIIEGYTDLINQNEQSYFDFPTNLDSTFDADNNNIESNISGNMECNLNNNNINPSQTFSYHNDERVESNLLKLMLEIGAPNYAYKNRMNWAQDASKTGYQFNPRAGSYKCQIKKLKNIIRWIYYVHI